MHYRRRAGGGTVRVAADCTAMLTTLVVATVALWLLAGARHLAAAETPTGRTRDLHTVR